MRLRGAVVGVSVLLGWGEWQNRRWSRTLVGDPPGADEVIVVLGFRSPQAWAQITQPKCPGGDNTGIEAVPPS